MRAFLIVLDSVGIGAAPDASEYGDEGSNTLSHLSDEAGGLSVPVMQRMGLGNISALIPGGMPIKGVDAHPRPVSSYGAMEEVSRGKDTTTGHWEMAGLKLIQGFHVFPQEYPSFPSELVSAFEERTGRKVMCNYAVSGTAIINELGKVQMANGQWIVYTSADSVFQIAAHEDIIPLEELYDACDKARELCDEYFVGRVIARPYVGEPGSFKRTENRRDYSFPLPGPTILNLLTDRDISVTTVGKLDDIFANSGITTSHHVENNADATAVVLDIAHTAGEGLIFVNLIDFDMLYGHRRDSFGYARSLERADVFIGELMELMREDDLLIISADHGNDPTFQGTDHTREFVPLLVHKPGQIGESLGIRHGFYDVAQSLTQWFGIDSIENGRSFLI